jgi:RNA polymerase sigma factor (sigma-70 family)
MPTHNTDRPLPPSPPEADDGPISSVRRTESARPPAPPGLRVVAKTDRPDQWFDEIYRLHQGLVWKILPTDIPPPSREGLHQDIFFKFHEKTEKVRPDNPPGLLTEIAKLTLANYLKRRRRRPRLENIDDVPELPIAELDADQLFRDGELHELMEAAIAKLSQANAELIRWIDLGGLTHAEVAAILGIEGEALKSRHRRARKCFLNVARRLDAKIRGAK